MQVPYHARRRPGHDVGWRVDFDVEADGHNSDRGRHAFDRVAPEADATGVAELLDLRVCPAEEIAYLVDGPVRMAVLADPEGTVSTVSRFDPTMSG